MTSGDTTLLPGETLKARLERRSLPLAEVLDLSAQIAAALASLHERGQIHGDLRPALVWISPEEQVELLAPELGRPGGTPYSAPEQIRGGPVDARTDVWSLGVILYEMLAGRPPFSGTGTTLSRSIFEGALEGAPMPLGPRLPGFPAGLLRIVEQALSENPDRRYGRVEEMREDLLEVDAELPADDEESSRTGGGHAAPVLFPAVLTGRTVSHFRIDEPLGGGGMGVLYRAADVNLGRTVALKFLAPELVRDAIAKTRFLTEARAASALDHPNLCTILEVGETEEGLFFLAMPLYQGESLEHRLTRGPLPLDLALDIATQAARGLAKAHQNGIFHRDVKPANLFLTGDGTVKVLDFGIAKLRGETGPTRRGTLLGTPAYMAPEQTRGEATDARADVWSMGVVLYEMLAGRRPFTGGTDVAVVHSVLHEDPEPLSKLRPEVPPEVERIVEVMLAKDPADRYRDAGEALTDLRRAQGLASTTLSSGLPLAVRKRRRRTTAALLGVGLAAGIFGVGFLAWHRSGRGAAPQPANFVHLTDLPGRETFPSLSPDGTFFVYAKEVDGNFDLFLQRVAGGSPIRLAANSPADDTQPAFSPDGQQIAFRSERDGGGVFLMGATGESVKRLTDFGFNPAWSPDGKEIAVATESALDPASRESKSQIFRVDVATGTHRLSLDLPDGVQPSFSPHGKRIAYWGLAQPGARRAIWTVPVGGGTPVPVVDDVYYNWSPVWSPDAQFLYFATNRGGSMNLWRLPIDEDSGEVRGVPQPLTTPSVWSALPSFSKDGRLMIYATRDNRSFIEQTPFAPERGKTGAPTLIYQGARTIWSADFSPDGEWLVFRSSSPQEDLFLIRKDGTDLRQLTNDPARDRAPRWSPDGRAILFASNRSGKYEAWTIRPDGSGLSQVTHTEDPQPVLNPTWSPSGHQIGFTYGSFGTALFDLRNPAAGLHILPRVEGRQVLARPSWSSDGHYLAGILLHPDESPVPGIVVWSLADNTYRRLTQTGKDPEFCHDGRRILYLDRGEVWMVDAKTGEAKSLLSSPPPHSSYESASAGPGDRTLCTVRTTDEGDIWMLSLDPNGRP